MTICLYFNDTIQLHATQIGNFIAWENGKYLKLKKIVFGIEKIILSIIFLLDLIFQTHYKIE